MTTDPFRKLLDPEFAIAGAKAIIEVVSPLLGEVINHATWAFQRCQSEKSSHAGIDEDLAAFILYRHVIEFTDAIEVLLSKVCAVPSVVLLRSSFEACLSLEYIMRSDYSNRSLAWLCEYGHRRLKMYHILDQNNALGKEFSRAWEQEFSSSFPTHVDVSTEISRLQVFLSKPHMVPIEKEYQRQKKAQKCSPKWFSLFDGPRDLRSLASLLKHQVEYDHLYRYWSSTTHAGDVAAYLTKSSQGTGAFKSIRYPEGFKDTSLLAVTLQLRATRLMIDHFRAGEDLSCWFSTKVKPAYDQLKSLQITIEDDEI